MSKPRVLRGEWFRPAGEMGEITHRIICLLVSLLTRKDVVFELRSIGPWITEKLLLPICIACHREVDFDKGKAFVIRKKGRLSGAVSLVCAECAQLPDAGLVEAAFTGLGFEVTESLKLKHENDEDNELLLYRLTSVR
jgi:hypothetical protein